MSAVRLVRFRITSGAEPLLAMIRKEVLPLVRARPGFERVVLFADPDEGEAGLLVVWASREDADAAAPHVGPTLFGLLRGHVAEAPEPRLFDVLEQHASAAPAPHADVRARP